MDKGGQMYKLPVINCPLYILGAYDTANTIIISLIYGI